MPEEAEAAETVGTIAMGLVGVVIIFMFITDIPNYLLFFLNVKEGVQTLIALKAAKAVHNTAEPYVMGNTG